MMQQELPAVRLVDELIQHALLQRASDVHLEPGKDVLRVRYRIDGVLHNQKIIEQDSMLHVLSRIKVLARMDVAERRIPQDGTWRITHDNQPMDVRVSTFPTMHGEKVVMRLLRTLKSTFNLAALGFSQEMQKEFAQLIQRPHGFFMVTGPTGVGKTTTLYAALHQLCMQEKNVVTLEDPIEYHVPGITQSQIFHEIGFTFSKGLRALLRQDPDVILVGEIRDKETAEVAIQAALTGHLVFSTLHTTDAPSTLVRLLDMEVAPFLINAALTGVLSQRLVRVLCVHCRQQGHLSESLQHMMQVHAFSIESAYHAVGCKECNYTGYKGRVGIFELLVITPSMRDVVRQGADVDAIYAQAHRDGMYTMKADACHKVAQGITDLAELIRVVF